MEKHDFTVNNEQQGQRLDLYLAFVLPEYSRSFLKKQIVEERVRVNGKCEFHPQYRVKVGDLVSVEIKKQQEVSKIVPREIPFEVVYEDQAILAINKEVGMVVHPAAGHFDDTLANAVKFYLSKKGQDIFGVERAGLVHRLDKATSGLIVFAKTPQALWNISQQFAQRQVEKTYLVAVQGETPQKFSSSKPIGRSPKSRQKFSTDARRHRSALTHFELLAYSEDKKYSLLYAHPHTGRTHQIRVHLKEKGYPVIGDKKYGGEKNSRMLLHAFRLKLTHPDTEKSLELEAPPDEKFLQSLVERGFAEVPL